MHQIMLSLIMYTNENNNVLPLPPRVGQVFPGTGGTPKDRSLAYYAPQLGVIDYDHGAFWKYVAATNSSATGIHPQALQRVFTCPSDNDSRDYGQTTPRNFSYSWNGEIATGLPSDWPQVRKYTQIRNPRAQGPPD